MRRRDTWTGEHHIVPRGGDWGRTYPRLWDELYEDQTIFLQHDEHVQVQRDTKEYGPIGAQGRLWLHRLCR